MRIRKVVASAFGPFEDETLEFGPGMNVVCGPNESGKSSWHGALYAALCGMRRSRGRARTEDQNFTNRHRPWHLDRWEVAAEVLLSDGRALELRHDLDGRVDSRITDLGTAEDVSASYIYDGAPDGARLLGLTRDIIPSTVFVRQADMFAVTENAENLQEQLQRAAATSGEAATAEEALKLITEYKREHVGSTVAHSTKPLRRALSELDDHRRTLEHARAQHDGYVALAEQAREAAAEADQARSLLKVARALKVHREAEELSSRLERAEQISRDLPPERPPVRAESHEKAEVLRDALAAFRARPEVEPLADGPSVADLESDLAALPEIPPGDTEPHESVSAAANLWRDRVVALETASESAVEAPTVPEIGSSPTELRRLADDLDATIPEVDPVLLQRLKGSQEGEAKGSSGLGLVAGTVIAVGGLVLILAGQQILGLSLAGAGLALVLFAAIRRQEAARKVPTAQIEARVAVQQETKRQAEERRTWALARAKALDLTGSADELRRLAARLEQAESGKTRHEEWRRRVGALEAEVDGAVAGLRTALKARGVESAEDPGNAIEDILDRYRGECRERAREARVAARRESIETLLASRRSQERTHHEVQRKRGAAADRLERAAHGVGVEGQDPEALASAAEAWLKEEEAREEADRTAREAWARLEEVLGEQSVDELREKVASLTASLPMLPDEWRELAGPGLLDRLDELESDTEKKAGEANRLQGMLKDRARNLPSVAAAEERLQKAEEELARVKRLETTLERTHQFLSDARDQVQRAIAPRLREAIDGRLPRVTSGRYSEALVNPDTLEVKVRAGGGDWRNASLLSHGTAEQVYLLLRIGLVEFIATSGEPAPLILDDVTVQCDAARTEALLETLMELSDERQVILFSQERQVHDWARGKLTGANHRLIELDAPTVAASVG